jgi:hypothetical protein
MREGLVVDFPIYLLRLDEQWQIEIPNNKEDIGHTDFWEQAVSGIVADFYKIPRAKLVNLPYCQRRARIVGNKAYFGGRPDADLLHAIQSATGNANLVFCFDGHERRLKEDVLEFRRLVRRYSVNDRNQPPRKPGQRQ